MGRSKDLAELLKTRRTLTAVSLRERLLSLTKAERASTARKKKRQDQEEKQL
jgi:hypothetical protein